MPYTTSDLNLATVLAMSFDILELINDNGRGTFIFEDSDEVLDTVENYWNKKLQVEPQTLLDTFKGLKNRLYNDIKKGKTK